MNENNFVNKAKIFKMAYKTASGIQEVHVLVILSFKNHNGN